MTLTPIHWTPAPVVSTFYEVTAGNLEELAAFITGLPECQRTVNVVDGGLSWDMFFNDGAGRAEVGQFIYQPSNVPFPDVAPSNPLLDGTGQPATAGALFAFETPTPE